MSSSPNKQRFFTKEQLLHFLSNASGKRVTGEMIDDAVRAGFPTNNDGLYDPVLLAAWCNREINHGAKHDKHDVHQPDLRNQ